MQILSLLSHINKSVLLWIIRASYADTFIRNGIRKFDAEGYWANAFLDTCGVSSWVYILHMIVGTTIGSDFFELHSQCFYIL